LKRQGVDIEVFTTDADGEAALPRVITDAGSFEGVPVRYFPRTWPLEPIGSRECAATLRGTVRRFDALHIHGLWNRVVWAAAREARRARVPYVLSPRGMLESAALAHRAWRKRLAYAAIERHTIEGAAVCHATSPGEATTLRAIKPDAAVCLIPNGVETPPAGVDAPCDTPPTFVFVGRLHAIKRLDLLIDAFARVAAVSPEARLVIAGPDEQGLRASLEARHPLGARVTWLGAVDAARRDAVLAQARALVLCSDSESFGMAVVEAMAAGRAVIVTRTCGWNDLERRGAGLLVDQTPAAIADAMLRLLDVRAAAEMGVKGRRWVEEAFTWDAVAGRFIETYSTLGQAVPT